MYKKAIECAPAAVRMGVHDVLKGHWLKSKSKLRPNGVRCSRTDLLRGLTADSQGPSEGTELSAEGVGTQVRGMMAAGT